MIRKFVRWDSNGSAGLDGLPRTVATEVERFIVPDGREAVEAGQFPVATQLAIRRHLSKARIGGEVRLSSEKGIPFLSLAGPITLEDLQLSVRSANCLRAAEVKTLEDLLEWTAAELMDLPHFGAKCLREINDLLSQMGCSLTNSMLFRGIAQGTSFPEEEDVPLAGLLQFEEFLRDRPVCESLRRAGWGSAVDLSIHSLSSVSSIASLDEKQTGILGAALQEVGIELPFAVPAWLQGNLTAVRATFDEEITGFLKSFQDAPHRAASISSAESLYEELQGLIPKKYSAEKRRIVSQLYGFEGQDPMTLDAVARTITPALTRERVRQIALPVTTALSDPHLERPWLVRTIRCLEQLAPCNTVDAAKILVEEQISGRLITVASILSLARRASIDTELVLEGENLRATHTALYLSEIARKAVKFSSRWGVADWQEVTQALPAELLSSEDRMLPEAVYLDDARRYFVFPNRENSLANRLARILAVAPSLPLADAYRGLFRDTRMEQNRLPETLFPRFCGLWDWCRIEGDLLQATATLPSADASGDDLIVLLLKEAGRPLQRRAILTLAQQHGLSETTVTHALSYSNVIASHAGYFSVIGDPQLYESQSEPINEPLAFKAESNRMVPEPESHGDSILLACTDPKAFVESVLLKVRRRLNELQISTQWSVAELGLSHADRQSLLRWGRSATWDFRSETGSYRLPGGELVRKRTALGLTFLLFASVVDREFADSSSVWPAIESALGDEQRDNFMFRAGVPKSALRDGIEDACRQLGLRHGFEDSGQQVIWRTVGLQFGLRRSHLSQLQRMLGEPVMSQPVAIQLLLGSGGPNFSVSFQSAWVLLKAVRSHSISDNKATEELAKNPWLAAFVAQEILSACRTTSPTSHSDRFVDAEVKQDAYAYFGSPQLVLDGQEVYLEFELSPDAPAWVDVPALTFLCEEPYRKERIQIQSGGWSMTGGSVRLPLTRRRDSTFRFQLLRGRELALEENAGVLLDTERPFLLFRNSGRLMDEDEEIPEGNGLLVLATNEVQLSGIARDSAFRAVLNGRARLTIVAPSETSKLRITRTTGEIVWTGDRERSVDTQKSNVRIEVAGSRWGQRTRITLPPLSFAPRRLRLNSGEVLEVCEDCGQFTVESGPSLSRAQAARIYGPASMQARSLPGSLVHRGIAYGAAIEQQGKWSALNGSEVLDGATLGASRVLAKVQNASLHQELCWTEGCRALSGLKVYGGSLLNVYGVGEPLRISAGIYNRPDTLLNVANAVTDDGFLRNVNETAPGEWVATLPFDTDLEEQHSLWVWSDAAICPTEIPRSSISKAGLTMRWKVSRELVVFGWAVSFAGQRMGSTRIRATLDEFAKHLHEHWSNVVEWIRWWHVPVLQEEFRRMAKLSAERFPVETLTAWNGCGSAQKGLVFDELRDEAWATASRELLWNWRPTSAQAIAVAKSFDLWTGDIDRDSSDRTDIPGLGPLARVSPLLFARVVAKALPEFYSFPLRELAILVALLLKAVNENALSESFRIRDMCERYAQGESRLDGEFISRSILKAASAEFRGEPVERHNLQAAFHQSGLREIVAISLLREILVNWKDGAKPI